MPSPMCMRCLTRSIHQIESPLLNSSRAFSTSTRLLASTKKAAPVQKKGSSLRLAKKKRAVNARPPAAGERKALRKRVLLSNVNAVEVPGLVDLSKTNCAAKELDARVGQMIGFDEPTIELLRSLEGFKPTQGWGLFRRPATLIREETVDLARSLDAISQTPGRVVRTVLTGERGSGKSVLQLQAIAMAALKGWIVVHFPEANEITIGHTAYEPSSTADGTTSTDTAPTHTTYDQPQFTAKLLDNIGKANRAVLAGLRLSHQHDLPVPVSADTTLAQLVDLGARDPDIAVRVWAALRRELHTRSNPDQPGLRRPPVLYTLDNLHHACRASGYLDATAQPVHAHDLSLVREFMSLLQSPPDAATTTTTDAVFPNGGMVLAAVSGSNRAAAPTLDLLLARRAARQAGGRAPGFAPYAVHDDRVCRVFGDGPGAGKAAGHEVEADKIRVLEARGLSKVGSRGVLEYYARSGMLRGAVTEALVAEKWTLAGGGIVGQIERDSVMTSRV